MPISCSAIYGIVASTPVIATASSSAREPYAAMHHVRRRDMPTLGRHRPKPRHDGEHHRVDQNRIGQREKPIRANGIHQSRYRDHGIGGVKIATHQEPRDPGAELPSAQAPLIQMRQRRRLAPFRRDEPHDRHRRKECDEHTQRRPVDIGADHTPSPRPELRPDQIGQPRRDRHPGQLIPVEERKPEQRRFRLRIERNPQQPDERQQQQQRQDTASPIRPRLSAVGEVAMSNCRGADKQPPSRLRRPAPWPDPSP